MKIIKSFLSIIDHQTVIITVLSLVSTYVCIRFKWAANMPSGLIGVAVIFPIVFSINAAYRRRESALGYFSSFKGHAISLYWAHRDWVPEGSEQAAAGRELISELFTALPPYFKAPAHQANQEIERIYDIFSALSKSHEESRKAGLTAGEVSRSNQYLKALIVDFDRMRNIRLYRTPMALRAYSSIFLNAFPIFFGPYFAYLAINQFQAVGYAVAILYSLVLVSLDNIQEDLEDPYDGVGEDDIHLDIIGDYQKVLDL